VSRRRRHQSFFSFASISGLGTAAAAAAHHTHEGSVGKTQDCFFVVPGSVIHESMKEKVRAVAILHFACTLSDAGLSIYHMHRNYFPLASACANEGHWQTGCHWLRSCHALEVVLCTWGLD
jgi:hypothetical protein